MNISSQIEMSQYGVKILTLPDHSLGTDRPEQQWSNLTVGVGINKYMNDFKIWVMTKWDLSDKGKHVLKWFGIRRAKLFQVLQQPSQKHGANVQCCTSSVGGT